MIRWLLRNIEKKRCGKIVGVKPDDATISARDDSALEACDESRADGAPLRTTRKRSCRFSSKDRGWETRAASPLRLLTSTSDSFAAAGDVRACMREKIEVAWIR